MTVPSLEELDSLKYSDLQNLAKSLGLRANLRADKLLKSLKAHLKQQARKENENRDESPTSSSSCDETEMQVTSWGQAEPHPAGHVAKTRRRCRTVHHNPDSQVNGCVQTEEKPLPGPELDHSETKTSDPTEFQSQEKQDTQTLRTAADVPSPPGNEDSKVPSERKKSVYTDGFSKSGKNKRIASTTPNFKKLHEARFKEMESIDQYVKRKKKHFEQHILLNELKIYRTAVARLETLSSNLQAKSNKAKSQLQTSPFLHRNSFHVCGRTTWVENERRCLKQPITKGLAATPAGLQGRLSLARTPASQQRSQGQARGAADQSSLCVKGSAKRSTLSATKMNVRFSAATKDNEYKRSLTKTPARKSPHVTVPGNTPTGQAVLGTNQLKTTKRESATAFTPFKLSAGAVQTPVSSRKPVFDLKASLSRPLTYEPHKGKLKPWGQSKENKSLNEHVSRVSFHKKTYKQPRLQTREEQRKKHEQERKEKKAKVLGTRRGLIMAAD